uniref:Uncharacterized protein n=1 Tax=Romanomermis culicivorax TaxID=13658 RepID=A0A915I0R3_ROMCU
MVEERVFCKKNLQKLLFSKQNLRAIARILLYCTVLGWLRLGKEKRQSSCSTVLLPWNLQHWRILKKRQKPSILSYFYKD